MLRSLFTLSHGSWGYFPEGKKIMWKLSFLEVIWKERNARCFEREILHLPSLHGQSQSLSGLLGLLSCRPFKEYHESFSVLVWREVTSSFHAS